MSDAPDIDPSTGICFIQDCRCPAGDDARITFARVNLLCDREVGDTAEFREAWDEWRAATEARYAACPFRTATA